MDRLVTLFGGGGFLGRYVAQELLKAGARIRVAERNPAGAWFVKTLGGLGQTQFAVADITRAESAEAVARGSQAVINLVGILKGDFDGVHVAGARNVAAAAAKTGAEAFVQVSAIGADTTSESAYGRSKGEGEAAVQAAFPGATIIRPSVIFGAEDQFVNRFAQMASALPLLPVIKGDARFQPVWVADVARAIAQSALNPKIHAGETYELGGPTIISMAELNCWIAAEIGRPTEPLLVPDCAAALLARFTGFLPGAPITQDQWLMLQKDNVVAAEAKGFEAFDINPSPLAAIAPSWLVRFRRHGRFGAHHPAS